jgi:hypothetical protein
MSDSTMSDADKVSFTLRDGCRILRRDISSDIAPYGIHSCFATPWNSGIMPCFGSKLGHHLQRIVLDNFGLQHALAPARIFTSRRMRQTSPALIT